MDKYKLKKTTWAKEQVSKTFGNVVCQIAFTVSRQQETWKNVLMNSIREKKPWTIEQVSKKMNKKDGLTKTIHKCSNTRTFGNITCQLLSENSKRTQERKRQNNLPRFFPFESI